MDLARFAPTGFARAPAGEDGLRPLDWTELCARLAAAHHARRALAAGEAGRSPSGSASFAPHAVQRPAAPARKDDRCG